MIVFQESETWTLIASAASLEKMQAVIAKYWYSSSITLTPVRDGEWSVANAKGVRDGFRVVKVGGRFRFENRNG
jgi:hypothetical protein